MVDIKRETIARVVLFEQFEDKHNAPKFKGYMESDKGKYTVTLWEEVSGAGKKYYKGQVTKETINE